MSVVLARTATLSVAASSELKTLVDACKKAGWALTASQASLDTTGQSDVANTAVAGLVDWSATANLMFPTSPTLGNGLLVTYSAGYTAHLQSLTLNINREVAGPYTDANATPPTGVEYYPGNLSWGGQYVALMDDTTALELGSTTPNAPGTAGNAATFKIRENDADDDTFAGNIVLTQTTPDATGNQMQQATHTFVGSGDLTAAGTENMFAAGTIGIPSATEVVFTSATGRTFTGDAFLESVTITVNPRQVVTVAANLRGTGALTVA